MTPAGEELGGLGSGRGNGPLSSLRPRAGARRAEKRRAREVSQQHGGQERVERVGSSCGETGRMPDTGPEGREREVVLPGRAVEMSPSSEPRGAQSAGVKGHWGEKTGSGWECLGRLLWTPKSS